METDGTSSAGISPSLISSCLSSETKFAGGEHSGPFSDDLCPRCQNLKIDDESLDELDATDELFATFYSLEDSLPGLPVLSQSARHGCNFCELLKSIIIEFVSHGQRLQWLGSSRVRVRPHIRWCPTYTFLCDADLSYLTVPVRFESLLNLEQRVEYKTYEIHFEVEGENRLYKTKLLLLLINNLSRR